MSRITPLLVLALGSVVFAQNALTVTSAASNSTTVTAGSLATAMGSNIVTTTAIAVATPWPTTLGDVTVQVKDSAGVSRAAGVLFVAPSQINFQVPPDTALGVAAVLVTSDANTFAGQVNIAAAAPALFAIDSSGIAAATAVRVTLPTQVQSSVPVFLCPGTTGGCSLVPIDPGVDAPVYLSFYGTGIGTGPAVVNFGSIAVDAIYTGPQGEFPGLDQVNVPLTLDLRGEGLVVVTLTVNGVTSNPVKISVQ
jgi:uncharacterized protein (TIGR03437 family)